MLSRAALLVVGLAIVTIAVTQNPQQRSEWNEPVAPFRVIGNIHFVGTGGVSAFLFSTPEGLILLDGGLPETAALIAASIETLGFRLRDVKYLLNTHAHFDHAGGLAELKRRSGAIMVASAGDAAALRAGGPEMPAVEVGRVIEDGGTVSLGGTTLTANVTPGHTKGCTTWTATTKEGERTYRVVVNCSITVVERLVGNTAYPGIVSDFERTFTRFRQLQGDVFLSSHPSAFRMEEKLKTKRAGAPNPFVNPEELARFVDDAERAFRAELKKQQTSR